MNTDRLDANRLLLKVLSDAVETYPEQRFGQLLLNLGVVTLDVQGNIQDPFSEESSVTLRRVQKMSERS
ncbi:hypothetical protein [Deinococcus hopiensis]|uniref:Uncharacterized protein n=1 Tax=Deinococcus hopiensis KR-140 TaxID=695939 RepID=A0A1W1V716_9DEIO|nr:hypothetical protein [Deinococcus hopiensis]SMB88821.1 hypothetical protein SAMN00790413_00189 [Deinococcus hopiensis KR-140]